MKKKITKTDPERLITHWELWCGWTTQSYSFPILPSAGEPSALCPQRLSQSLELPLLLHLGLQTIGSWWWTRRNLLYHHVSLQPERQSQVGHHISPHLIFCLLKAYGLILTYKVRACFSFSYQLQWESHLVALYVTPVLSGFFHLQQVGFGVTSVNDDFGFCLSFFFIFFNSYLSP